MKRFKTSVRNISYFGVLALATSACGSVDDDDQAAAPGAQLGASKLSAASQNIRWSAHSDWCLATSGGAQSNGTHVILEPCAKKASQQWSTSGGQFKLFGTKCLDVTNGGKKNGTKLQIWDCDLSNANQQWSSKNDQISWSSSGKCVDVTDGKVSSGQPIQVWSCDTSNENQKFTSATSNTVAGSSSSGTVGSSTATAQRTKAPASLDVSPYFATWASDSSYLIKTIGDAVSKAGANSLHIAFGIASSKNGCKLTNDLSSLNSQLKSFASSGKRVVLSFGGASGTYIQQSCTTTGSIANVIASEMDAIGQHNIDFDVENSSLGNRTVNGRLISALKNLQERYGDLYISYTLPVDYHGGLGGDSIQFIKDTKAAGVLLSRVNIMTMDFGSGQGTSNVGDMTIGATNTTFVQLKKIYSNYTDSQIYNLIGITPMIGENDDHLKFTISDAQRIAKYAKQNGIGMLSFWNIHRDRAKSGGLDDYSNVSQSNYQFLKVFQAAQ